MLWSTHKKENTMVKSDADSFDLIKSHLMKEMTEEVWRTVKIFNWQTLERLDDVFQKKTKFVHYTSAEVALSIITNKCVWLRNASCMNDFSEVYHGTDQLIDFFGSKEISNEFRQTLDNISPGLSDEVITLFDSWIYDLKENTYLICLSEHDDKEDETGRLSMWRGYGQQTGVALVINPEVMMASSDALKAYSYPVHYYTRDETITEFKKVIERLKNELVFLKTQDVDFVKAMVFTMLQSYSYCLKHHGFKEEREWRVVNRPNQIHQSG